jgi:Ca2+-binding EF-hand superfamily protein
LDLNNDGRLSREELVIGFQKVLNEAQVEVEVDRIMKLVDRNDSGAIDYSGSNHFIYHFKNSFSLPLIAKTCSRSNS